MIIEMTYKQWQTIHKLLGMLPVKGLTDEDMDTAINLRYRIRNGSLDN